MDNLPAVIASPLAGLPGGLRDHIQRARAVGKELSTIHGVDAEAVDLGLAAHDLARAMTPSALLTQAHSHGIEPNMVERETPLLLHGPLAACWLERDEGFQNDSVIQAVRWHTTGSPDMDDVAKTVFLADKLDPDKIDRYPQLEEVRSKAVGSLNDAIARYLDLQIEYLLRRKLLIHPASLEFRNHLLAASDD